MCELFGYSSDNRKAINRELRVFFSHSTEHPHGWGLAVIDEDDSILEKQSIIAKDSLYLKNRLSEPVYANAALAHIRFATVGVPERKNTHPFVRKDKNGKRWILIHNGTLFEENVTRQYIDVQNGDTDSERILLYLIDRINHADTDDEFSVVEEVIAELAPHNKLNLIIYNGDYLFVHSNLRNTLHTLNRPGEVFISTSALTDYDWQPLPINTLFAYKDGTLVRQGKDHGHEHIPDPEKIKELYWAFSHL